MKDLTKLRPVWAEINLDNLKYNMMQIRNRVSKDIKVGAVIKADGYGHGALEIADTLLESGADYLMVATLGEALQLREKYDQVPILVLGYTPNECADDVINNNISQTIYNMEQAKYYNEMAEYLEKKAILHIKIDTGMGRLGFKPTPSSVEDILQINSLSHVELEGIYTHFAVADETDKTFTKEQFNKFVYVIETLEKNNVNIKIKHTSNSAAIIDMDSTHLDMVRAGIILYGLYPSENIQKSLLDVKPILSLKAKVSNVKVIDKGETVGYGRKYQAPDKTKIATIPIGYADGFTRMLSGKANVLINGKLAPVVGRICMDQCMVDVSSIENVKIGDEVVLIGSSGKNYISVDTIAQSLDTINYEVVCMINKRVPRVYIRENQVIHIKS
ncbi:alanine racemase [Anaeromicrobium sediminis]|uniref:Alanine racemase n=1 Tax=Anaeromicrobium sediminis TaxID=1478221 RepID=A0A267MIY4_9FIRM|nr:alanine racemase [Anaeromicrobium sediminis]PAB58753.1 alanine racemase [Anaeromicrobium sediminis]